MKEIEILREAEAGSKFDDNLGYYKVIKDGLDDIVIIKNYRYKTIKKSEVNTLTESSTTFKIEEVENCEKYVVKPLDTIKIISQKFNRSEEYIKNKNELKCDKLFIGQILKI